jgi:integrase
VGFHTFRHTVASRLFAEGRNILQVQRWLGYHSSSFTHVYLLDEDLGRDLKPLRVKENQAKVRKNGASAAVQPSAICSARKDARRLPSCC